MTELTPSPGSSKAVSAGCTCPVIDNGHGTGCGRVDDKGNPLFWMNQECPIHGYAEPTAIPAEEGPR